MKALIRVLRLVVTLLAVTATPAIAQQAAPVAFQPLEVERSGGPVSWAADDSVRPSAWKYAGIGALSAAVIAGVAFATYDAGDAILYEVVAVGGVLSAAVIGAGVGWVVHRVRYH